jgi:cellulose synthase/poly-beta-1,6-N-acetylglucosamine synthase-like glycosyltransferase
MPLLILTIALFILYCTIILRYWLAWQSIPVYIPPDIAPRNLPKISIIVPARNEEKTIGRLLQSLDEQTYPRHLLEVIVVDDYSTDNTAKVVMQYPHTILVQLQTDAINSYKKKAIEAGIKSASGGWIVTTDADCIPSPNWIYTLACFQEQKDAVFVAAPVCFNDSRSLLSVFQTLDFLVLQGITGASVYKNIHSMCNGANLAYEKKAFYAVGGFSGIDHIASGDDMLLMHKIWKQFPSRVHYLKASEAIVFTEPMPDLSGFFNQRIRWASKAAKFDDKRIFFVLLLVYLFNLSFPALLIAAIWDPLYLLWLTGLWAAKTVIEFPFVFSVCRFFGKQYLMKYFPLFQPLHIIYTIVSGLFGQFGRYEWKGRRVR